MSVHDELMADVGVPALMDVYADVVEIVPADSAQNAFPWSAAIGPEKGGDEQSLSGDLQKALRRSVLGPTSVLIANGVTALERRMKVKIGDVTYSVDLRDSVWGARLVQLGLVRRPIVEYEQLENAAVQ